MIRIAVIDDDPLFCAECERFVLAYSNVNKTEMDVEVFNSGESFMDFWHLEHQFDLIFLDIELYEMNGIEIGRILRKSEHNHQVQIVYVSAKENYAMDLFRNRPFDFLVKPISQDHISAVLNEYLLEFPQEHLYFEYVLERKKFRLLISKILYIQSNRKKVTVITVDGTFEIYGKLEEILAKQLSTLFIRIHRCYAINIQHITEFSFQDVVLTNGERLPISRPLQKDVSEQLLSLEHYRILYRSGLNES